MLSAIVLLLGIPGRVNAQIVPDVSLPVNSVVPNGCAACTIRGGTQVGGNLFHSFSQFSVPTGGEAFFDNSLSVSNIITRITGGSISSIDGLIRANGTASLFLINPNGIIFGSNASLNIGGSFIASTAISLKLSDGSEFSASNPQAPLLTITAPIGLQYGTNPTPIQVQEPIDTINGTVTDSGVYADPGNAGFVRFGLPGLQVPQGQTLALVGGDVTLTGGILTAPGGRVEVGSIRSGGLVTLFPDALGWKLSYNGVDHFGNIDLSQNAVVDVATNSGAGGEIWVQGGQVTLKDGSTLLAETQGIERGGNVWVKASDSLHIIGLGEDALGPLIPSSILTDVSLAGATGHGGNISIETNDLRVAEGGFISAGTFGAGNAGRLEVRARTIDLSGGSSAFGSSGLLVDTFGAGQGGVATIAVERLLIQDGARISANTFGLFGTGNAGEVKVNAGTIDLQGHSPSLGPSGLFSTVNSSSGNGGNLSITARELRVVGGAQIATTTIGAGNAGDLTVVTENLELVGSSADGASSGLFASADVGSSGSGGNLTVQTGQLRIANGAQAITSTFGTGNAGNLTVNARDIELVGRAGDKPSGLMASVELGATGNGGNLTIAAEQLRLKAGAQVITGTLGSGNAGNLIVTAQTVELSQSGSGLFATALIGTGAGGDIQVKSDRLTISDSATISASNFQSENLLPPGQGTAGNVQIESNAVLLETRGTITTASNGGSKGNIQVDSSLLTLRRGSSISTNATGSAIGGNIVINTDFLLAVKQENSDITANAVSNFGGQVTITTQGIFGITPGAHLTPLSDITASSDLGPQFSGSVEIRTPNLNPVQGLVSVPALGDVPQMVATCDRSISNRFVMSGRGGLPEDASQPLLGQATWQDLRFAENFAENSAIQTEYPQHSNQTEQRSTIAPKKLVEAVRVSIDQTGTVRLVAPVAQSDERREPWYTANCHSSQFVP